MIKNTDKLYLERLPWGGWTWTIFILQLGGYRQRDRNLGMIPQQVSRQDWKEKPVCSYPPQHRSLTHGPWAPTCGLGSLEIQLTTRCKNTPSLTELACYWGRCSYCLCFSTVLPINCCAVLSLRGNQKIALPERTKHWEFWHGGMHCKCTQRTSQRDFYAILQRRADRIYSSCSTTQC